MDIKTCFLVLLLTVGLLVIAIVRLLTVALIHVHLMISTVLSVIHELSVLNLVEILANGWLIIPSSIRTRFPILINLVVIHHAVWRLTVVVLLQLITIGLPIRLIVIAW